LYGPFSVIVIFIASSFARVSPKLMGIGTTRTASLCSAAGLGLSFGA
jgi:hypothetical protein